MKTESVVRVNPRGLHWVSIGLGYPDLNKALLQANAGTRKDCWVTMVKVPLLEELITYHPKAREILRGFSFGLVVDEEGIPKNLRPNATASVLAGQPLLGVGFIVRVGKKKLLGFTPEQQQAMEDVFASSSELYIRPMSPNSPLE